MPQSDSDSDRALFREDYVDLDARHADNDWNADTNLRNRQDWGPNPDPGRPIRLPRR